jgi:hypothetical protein
MGESTPPPRQAPGRGRARWGCAQARRLRGPAVPRLRGARGLARARAGRRRARGSQWARSGRGAAAAARGARTVGMDGERRASPPRGSGLAAGGAREDGAPGPGGRSSSALLPADVLDLDEDEDDLEVFSKVRARPAKVPGQLWSCHRRASLRGSATPSWLWGPGTPGACGPRLAAVLRARCRVVAGCKLQPRPPPHFDLPPGRAVA